MAEPPTPEFAGDEQYVRDLAALRERGRVEIAARRAKLGPNAQAAAKPQPSPTAAVAEPKPKS